MQNDTVIAELVRNVDMVIAYGFPEEIGTPVRTAAPSSGEAENDLPF